MAAVVDELSRLHYFDRLARSELERAAGRFRAVSLAPREAFWHEGAAVDELAIILTGELVATSKLKEVGRAKAPDLIGEASAFFAGQTRSASLRADTACELLVLSTPDLRGLRFERSRVYDVLLDQSLRALARRVAAVNARLAKVAAGSFAAPTRKEPGALAKLWRAFRPGGPSGPCPPAGPLVRQQAGLRELPETIEEQIAESFVPEPLEEGQVIVLEGEPGTVAWLVAEGTVEVLRNVRGDRAELLCKLGPGQMFGVNTLVESAPRSASCVAGSAGWLYRLDKQALDAMPSDARRLFRESMLSTLGTQLRGANAALELALRGLGAAGKAALLADAKTEDTEARRPASAHGFADLLRASGYLESLPANEDDLDAVRFVLDEDAIRNPKNRR